MTSKVQSLHSQHPPTLQKITLKQYFQDSNMVIKKLFFQIFHDEDQQLNLLKQTE